MFWILAISPWFVLLTTVIFSFVHAFTQWRPRVWVLRNAGAFWTVLVCLFITALTIVSRVIYTSGGCVHGLKIPAECTSIANGTGQWVHDLYLINIVAAPYFIPGALILVLIAEAITRPKR